MAFILGPNEVLDYGRDWRAKTHGRGATDWLADNETITAHTVTATSGVTVGAHTESDGLVVVWLSGGVPDTDVTLTFHITTSAGRQSDRPLFIAVRNRD